MPSKVPAKRAALAKAAAEGKRARERRGRKLIIAGAVLFVCTYGLKEVFRDELKGFSDSIAAAQGAADAGDAQQIISEREIAMNLRLRQAQEALADPTKSEILSKSDMQMDLLDLSNLYSDLEANVARVSDLVDRLPRWVKNRERARTEMKTSLDKAHQAMLDAIARSKEPTLERKKRVGVLLGIIGVEIYALEVAEWQQSITKTAKALKTIADTLYDCCTWGAFALTIVGVVLAARGKLHGDDGANV